MISRVVLPNEYELLTLLKENEGSLGNKKISELLNVNKATLPLLKSGLLQRGFIRHGKGRGGSTQLVYQGNLELITLLDNSQIDAIKKRLLEDEIIEKVFLREQFQYSEEAIFDLIVILETLGICAVQSRNLPYLIAHPQLHEKGAESRKPEIGNKNFFGEQWQIDGAKRLVELLNGDDLRSSLAAFCEPLVISKKQSTGRAELSLTDMAQALVLFYRENLFTNNIVRSAIIEEIGGEIEEYRDKRWVSGSPRARTFATLAQFPQIFAGLAGEEARLELVEYPIQEKTFPLVDYQIEVKNDVLKHFNHSNPRALVTLPTGAGKTRTATEIVFDNVKYSNDLQSKGCIVLWLAHSEELLEQAIEAFQKTWASFYSQNFTLKQARFFGEYWPKGLDFSSFKEKNCVSIVFATPVGIRNQFKEWKNEGILGEFSSQCEIAVIDEAHRSTASSYREVIEILDQHREKPIKLLGLTATPFRGNGDYDELLEHFKGTLFAPYKSLGSKIYLHTQVLAERKILAKGNLSQIELHTTLDLTKVKDLSHVEATLCELAAKNPIRRARIFENLLSLANNNASIMYFGPSVADAHAMSFLLNGRGIKSASVDAQTPTSVRRKIIDDFKSKSIQVLCNCKLFTAGFDAPGVTHVAIGYPTESVVLFEQMAGRGLRGPQFGGTESCEIIYFEDEIKGPAEIVARCKSAKEEVQNSLRKLVEPLTEQEREELRIETKVNRTVKSFPKKVSPIVNPDSDLPSNIKSLLSKYPEIKFEFGQEITDGSNNLIAKTAILNRHYRHCIVAIGANNDSRHLSELRLAGWAVRSATALSDIPLWDLENFLVPDFKRVEAHMSKKAAPQKEPVLDRNNFHTVREYLHRKGCQFVDQTHNGGAIWIEDNPGNKALIKEIIKADFDIRYTIEGSATTGKVRSYAIWPRVIKKAA